ncbi:serine/threonine-protein kinase [Candidatus Uabimicrobium sp. HlEnr_7]|uniref:serine/threonine-protein kinase n=1 Tax=Candidatus Uabimicrobium helgolandensis TaxID=3095367 RepID=UPI0035568CAE
MREKNKIIKDRYQLKRVIARGGMGKVFEAYDLKENRPVALKLLELNGPQAIQRFHREYESLCKINHPNIVKVYERFCIENRFFLVMEYVRGISLLEFIRNPRYHRITRQEQLKMFIDLSASIVEIHKLNIGHRDIKPSNIILNLRSKSIKLVDFGLAKQKAIDMTLTDAGALIGTPSYLSPEQINGDWSTKSDVFSLALSLYQFIIWLDHSPFQGSSKINTMINIQSKKLPILTDAISQEVKWLELLSDVIEKAMHKKPEKRICMSQFHQELKNIYRQSTTKKQNKNITNAKIFFKYFWLVLLVMCCFISTFFITILCIALPVWMISYHVEGAILDPQMELTYSGKKLGVICFGLGILYSCLLMGYARIFIGISVSSVAFLLFWDINIIRRSR